MEKELFGDIAFISAWEIQFHPFTINLFISLVIVLFLLFTSAMISGSEVAYFSLSPADKQKLKKKNRTNMQVLRNLENPESPLHWNLFYRWS